MRKLIKESLIKFRYVCSKEIKDIKNEKFINSQISLIKEIRTRRKIILIQSD